MKIRSLVQKDRERLHAILTHGDFFTPEEIHIAMELIDMVLNNQDQKDYTIDCMVDDRDDVLGYICYGPTPMTQGTFDLYWIVVDLDDQGKGVGSALLDFLEEALSRKEARMILADTSSISSYEKTQKFYIKKGFEEIARIPDYYFPGNDRITFCKKLR
jgi:ribosomal protein S18 acetylase RimI-like enzyme